ncbi:DNA (cytosine-5)-methyltransferase 1 [Halorientalis persicus]|uniref:DNA (cytosine-5-)-methyltransferase n=1 Tax=Halorientalis persicus TaxID=1367881 RepID=A0A1H8VVV8_9EURY|nr:DNA cytosine methyltransferase [Halorientalis persicus]SEP19068.1 DNA (cytosine-5)-methyltransferase 1 [Halorientalis persicus]
MSSHSETIRAVDLFAGAGGLSWGLVEALTEVAEHLNRPTEAVLEDTIDLVAINHWDTAISTHEENHPWARHYHSDVQAVNPREVFDEQDPDVRILTGGIECTHWSTARGGKPVDQQKREPAWDFLTWVQKLRPATVLVENVPEFERWGSIQADGTPSRDGETFDAWIDALHSLGYAVDWSVLNAADYGDATSRRRLFIIARRNGQPRFPEPTHSEDGDVPGTDEWRSAAEIIDWSDRGKSIWSRGLRGEGKKPLVNNTLQRIAEGVRRYCDDRLEPFADAIETIGKDDVRQMQDDIVPAHLVDDIAPTKDEPFLVKSTRGVTLHPPEVASQENSENAAPFPLTTPHLLGQHSNYVPRDVTEGTVPTIAARGAIQLVDPEPLILPRNGAHRGLHSNPAYRPTERPLHTVTAKNHDGHLLSPYLVPYYSERAGQAPRTHSITDPLPTITATGSDPYLAMPFIDEYYGNGSPNSITEPLPTVTTKDRFSLCLPEFYPFGLDIKYRLLKPAELAAATGFPNDYEFSGTKTEVTKQIGNAVPVNLATALCEAALRDQDPTLFDFESADTPSGQGHPGAADDD